LAEFAASSRVASHQTAEIIGIARRNRPADDRNAGPGSSWVWIASQLGVTQKAAHERYGKISPQPGRAAINTLTSLAGSNSATICPVGDPDLNDPQIVMLELAHGMLIDTGTYIDCPYRYWRVAQVPVDGRLAGWSAKPIGNCFCAGLDIRCLMRQSI
jgi:hypothetical protein